MLSHFAVRGAAGRLAVSMIYSLIISLPSLRSKAEQYFFFFFCHLTTKPLSAGAEASGKVRIPFLCSNDRDVYFSLEKVVEQQGEKKSFNTKLDEP